MRNTSNYPLWLVTLLVCTCLVGCANQLKVPSDARVVWSGTIDGSRNQWKNLSWSDAGQVYLVDGRTDQVVGVRTIWPEKPSFTFYDLDVNRKYHLFFRPDPTFITKSSEDNNDSLR